METTLYSILSYHYMSKKRFMITSNPIYIQCESKRCLYFAANFSLSKILELSQCHSACFVVFTLPLSSM